jgi:hypothetical protein
MHFRKVLKTSLVGMEELGRFRLTDSLSCLVSIPPHYAGEAGFTGLVSGRGWGPSH